MNPTEKEENTMKKQVSMLLILVFLITLSPTYAGAEENAESFTVEEI